MTMWRTAVLSGLTLSLAVPLVSACSSSTPHASAPATASTCQQVSAVLTDGPDPGADPVGYAEAQILPLRQIRTPDTTLGMAIADLASAYSGYSAASNASKAATATLTTAISKINALCPGAGATP